MCGGETGWFVLCQNSFGVFSLLNQTKVIHATGAKAKVNWEGCLNAFTDSICIACHLQENWSFRGDLSAGSAGALLNCPVQAEYYSPIDPREPSLCRDQAFWGFCLATQLTEQTAETAHPCKEKPFPSKHQQLCGGSLFNCLVQAGQCSKLLKHLIPAGESTLPVEVSCFFGGCSTTPLYQGA